MPNAKCRSLLNAIKTGSTTQRYFTGRLLRYTSFRILLLFLITHMAYRAATMKHWWRRQDWADALSYFLAMLWCGAPYPISPRPSIYIDGLEFTSLIISGVYWGAREKCTFLSITIANTDVNTSCDYLLTIFGIFKPMPLPLLLYAWWFYSSLILRGHRQLFTPFRMPQRNGKQTTKSRRLAPLYSLYAADALGPSAIQFSMELPILRYYLKVMMSAPVTGI